ncbi:MULTISPECIES: PadR family transcriptional regulator [unclassified Actinobaculum]|uniref:PadR family transcriptional regulator n=1 Tax=unclassified Actinobaculum TaxID=2609299 RepID=UPI000D52A7C6|nr:MULTISPECIES: PadR family transcriptional regulator [unclassified Actinobaculum]AWE42776.1 PadR family transcriptional regulator [Actinobaculum sp. 313]RTE49588.1 PadR family transcriptional regulator [Actinobaculum sp. 352]
MDTSLALLGLLGPAPGYGYDLKQSYDHWFGSRRPLAYGQVYATLARLIRDGLITLVAQEPGAGPERKRYEITEQGRKRVEEWMFTADPVADTLQSNLFAKTIIALLLGDDAQRLLDIQRSAHLARLRELTRAKQEADLRGALLADHAMFHIEADLQWIDVTEARLGSLRKEVQA